MNLSDNIVIIIEKIERMAECFYQQRKTVGYDYLNQILASLGQISESLSQCQNSGLDGYKLEFNQVLIRGMESIKQQDSVLIADIFYHEMAGLLIDIRNTIQ